MDFMDQLMDCLSKIDYSTFDEAYIDGLIDRRDSAPFDTEWCRVDAAVNAMKNGHAYTDENAEEQEKIREKAFMVLAQKTGSELAGYVSDDFGLIYDSIVCNYRDNWLDRLIEAYKNGRIPAGEL